MSIRLMTKKSAVHMKRKVEGLHFTERKVHERVHQYY